MKNSSPGALSWRQAAVTMVALPVVIALAVLAYAWPSARLGPRDLPVAVVGTAAGSSVVAGLEHSGPGGLDLHLYADEAAARSAIAHRDVYGAFVVAPGGVTVLEATAAGPAVAQLLDTAGRELAAHAAGSAPAASASSASARAAGGATGTPAAAAGERTVDVVPISADDPRGAVFSSTLLPLTICGILTAVVITLSGLLLPGWRRVFGLVTTSAVAGLGVYLVAQGFLGALPHDHVATWAALALTTLAIAAPAAGLATLIGPPGIGLGAVLMVFVGNPSSGSTSAPELLPTAVGDIGRWLPPGAGANLLRGTAYFDGSGSGGPVTVLALWSVLGLAAVATGRRRRGAAHGAPPAGSAEPAPEVTRLPGLAAG
ncbi:ABC transporter permease [Streptomyces sp. NPDC049040]|uniref:ABC transporter permease n=1 Tax=Streptomyces sp. NPDC049040 TaxID=3365593 RepID=UPI0037139A3B